MEPPFSVALLLMQQQDKGNWVNPMVVHSVDPLLVVVLSFVGLDVFKRKFMETGEAS